MKRPTRRQSADPCLTIRAAVLRQAARPLAIEELELEGPRDDEVLVRIVASGVCGTDVHFAETGAGGPVVLGHEGAGIVEEVGRAVRGVERGDHVVLSYQSCGHCTACRVDRPARCTHFWELNFGFARADGSNALQAHGVRGHFFGQSSFATHVLATRRNLVKVSKKLPLELLAPLGCGLQTGAGTVLNSLAVKRGEGLVVLGTGTVGLAAVMAGRVVGANPIVAVDLMPKRLALARNLGATHSINVHRSDVPKRLAAIAPHGIDYAVDTTGHQALIRAAAAGLKSGGKLALVADGGAPGDLPDGVEAIGVVDGDAVPSRFIPRLISLWQKGEFPFDRLVTFYDFDDINLAIAESAKGRAIKPILRISPTTP
jgi:aryl-alcohol dehydrogenase